VDALSPSLLRAFQVILSSLAIAWSVAYCLYLNSLSHSAVTEGLVCRYGVCDTDGALRVLQAQHGGDVASVPLERLLEFLERDSAGPNRWCDLGDALEKAGRNEQARYCFERAVELAPRVPYILFRAASFLLRRGNTTTALGMMAQAISGDPAYSQRVFAEYAQHDVTVDEILRFGLPNQQAGQAYLRQLLTDENASFASAAWRHLVSTGWIDAQLAADYVNSRIRAHDYDSAARSWAEYVGARRGDYLNSNYVFNGDFEQSPTQSPLDWRLRERPGLTVAVDSVVARSGQHSARIDFDGSQNVGPMELAQTAFVPPGQYRFEAYMKTDGLTTDQGVFFQMSAKDLIATTETIKESTDWRLVETAFQVPPDAGLVEVRVSRRPSLKFDNEIKGTVWIDQVRITKIM
jgi:Tfp pilus assembly protein PilF